MSGKLLIRLTGVLTCMAAITAGWDAEAGWRRRCCTPSCCTPVYTSCCDPCATSCCGGVIVSEVVVSEVYAPARCCASSGRETVVAATVAEARPKATAATPVVAKTNAAALR